MARLICSQCDRIYSANELVWRCECGGLLEIEFQARFDRQAIARRPPGLWRYREAIPLEDERNIVSFGEGYSPLVEVAFGRRSALVKQDHLFPTGSYKDRGASVLISKALELGVETVVEYSSGNAGCAISTIEVRPGLPGRSPPYAVRPLRVDFVPSATHCGHWKPTAATGQPELCEMHSLQFAPLGSSVAFEQLA